MHVHRCTPCAAGASVRRTCATRCVREPASRAAIAGARRRRPGWSGVRASASGCATVTRDAPIASTDRREGPRRSSTTASTSSRASATAPTRRRAASCRQSPVTPVDRRARRARVRADRAAAGHARPGDERRLPAPQRVDAGARRRAGGRCWCGSIRARTRAAPATSSKPTARASAAAATSSSSPSTIG